MARTGIEIEQLLVWAYQRQMVDRAEGSVLKGPRHVQAASWDGGGGGGGGKVDVHPDALAVHNAVMRLSVLGRGLVILNARTGSRPDWMQDALPQLGALKDARGRVVQFYDDVSKRAIGCYVRWTLTQESIDLARMTYHQWAISVGMVALNLNEADALEAHWLKPTLPPTEPWQAPTKRRLTVRKKLDIDTEHSGKAAPTG
jgi:hypothetical protein